MANCHLKDKEARSSVTQDKPEPSWQRCPLSVVPMLPTILGSYLPLLSFLKDQRDLENRLQVLQIV